MKHDILGEIKQTDGDVFDGVATIRYGARDIKLSMSRDGEPFETTLKLAADVVQRLPELDKLAKRVAVVDLRETYNNGWNEYDETQEDGSLKAVSNPKLSEMEFEAKLSGGPRRPPARGSHRSGRADLPHPAPQVTASLLRSILLKRSHGIGLR